MNSTESTVIELWNKGVAAQDIAFELSLDESIVDDIIEGESNYLSIGKGHRCALCGEDITAENFGVVRAELMSSGRWELKYYCKGCCYSEVASDGEVTDV